MIHIHSSLTPLSTDLVRGLPRETVSTCWRGSPLRLPFSWCLAVDPQAVWFLCSLQGGEIVPPSVGSGEFVEGLWEYDVAELFIMNEQGAYQEFNFSPSGAWWSMTHTKYRTRSESNVRPTVLSVDVARGKGEWSVVAALLRSSLQIPLFQTSRVHVSGISYQEGAVFLSSHPPHGIEPDFHHDECFTRAVFC